MKYFTGRIGNGGNILKATGIVRRIDDLGRIVIPKEIRKTLRIKEGSPLEIFTEKEGDIILKKYSPIGELSTFGTEYVESLSKVTGLISMITDKDSIIAVSGTSKKDLLEQKISNQLEKIMDNREFYNGVGIELIDNPKADSPRQYKSQLIAPIISEGDVIGSIILMSKETKEAGKDEILTLKTAASFLGSQMEI